MFPTCTSIDNNIISSDTVSPEFPRLDTNQHLATSPIPATLHTSLHGKRVCTLLSTLGISPPVDAPSNNLSVTTPLISSPRRFTNRTSSAPKNASSNITPPLVVIVDSGCGVVTVPSSNLTSDNHRPTTPMILETASSQEFRPKLVGDFRGLDAHIVPEFNNILIGLSNLLSKNYALSTDEDMFVFPKNKKNRKLFKEFHQNILQSIKFIAKVKDGVYQVDLDDLPTNLTSNSELIQPSLHRMTNVIHRYQTANFSNISDLVKFFHELLGHPSIETMISIIESASISNFPSELTTQAVRKYFPFNCISCPAGQLARRPPLAPEISTTSLAGEEFEVDFKGPWHNADGKQVLSLSRNKLMFTAVDVHKDFLFTRGTPSTASPVKHLEKLRLFALKRTGNRLKVIRSDDDFWDEEIKEWASQPEINVSLLPSIPHEHDRVKKIERAHRTISEMVKKSLAFKPHLSDRYWEMAYKHSAELRNNCPRKKLDGKSPFQVYFGKPYDLITHPIFPFGSIIMSHVPTKSQTSLGDNGIETFYVGIAHDHNGGARVYNPVTKLTTTRHSFKFVDTLDPIAPTYLIDSSLSSLINCPLPPTSAPSPLILAKKGPTRTRGRLGSLVQTEPIDSSVVEPIASPSSTNKERGPMALLSLDTKKGPTRNRGQKGTLVRSETVDAPLLNHATFPSSTKEVGPSTRKITFDRKISFTNPLEHEVGPSTRKVTFQLPNEQEVGPTVQQTILPTPVSETTGNGNVHRSAPGPAPTTRASSREKKVPTRLSPDMKPTIIRAPQKFPISEKLSPMLVKFGKTGASTSPVLDSATILQDVLDSDEPRWTHTSLDYQVAPVLLRPHYDNIGRTFVDKQNSMTYEIVDICYSSAPAPEVPMNTYKYYDTSVFSSPPSNPDMYEYEGIDFFLAETQCKFTSKHVRYLKRRITQLKTRKQYILPTIPLSVTQAKQH